jgi:hypothetical protein
MHFAMTYAPFICNLQIAVSLGQAMPTFLMKITRLFLKNFFKKSSGTFFAQRTR